MDRRLMGELRGIRSAFLTNIALNLLMALTVIGQAFFLSQIINQVFLNHATRLDILSPLLVLFLLIILRALFNSLSNISAARVAIHIKSDLRQRFVEHLLLLGPIFIRGEHSGELTLAVTEGIEALDAFFRDYLPALLMAFLIPLTILIVVLPLDLWTFAVLLITIPLIPMFMALIGMAAGRLAQRQYSVMSQMSSHFLDVMQGLTTLKLFNRSKKQIKTIRLITDKFREATMQVLRLAFLSAFVLELVATISIALVAVEIGLRLLYGDIAFEQAIFLLIIAPEFYQPLRQLGAKFHAGRDATAAADRIYAVLDTIVTLNDGSQMPPERMNIEFRDVHLSYEGRSALRGVTFGVGDGEMLALVGKSGAGKTSIANLLLRFDAPTEGIIKIADVDLQSIDPTLWREQITWIAQSAYLFNQSVEDNIRIGKRDASDDEIIAAAKQAQAHDFIMQLENGYDTIVGEQGIRLSGGQIQRVALARAFLRDTPLVLLDEATAHLDSVNEEQLNTSIREWARGHTVIVIAHRLNTIIDADRILVMDNGQTVQEGTHSSLLAEGGLYRQLVDAFGELS